MPRALLAAASAVLLLGAAKPATVDYRLGLGAASPLADVEIRFRGDVDGETRLVTPAALVSGLTVKGARVEAPDATHRVLRHAPGAKLTLRYRIAVTGHGGGLAFLGEAVFAAPQGREGEAATFRARKLPAGWRLASDLEHGAMGRPMTVDDVVRSVTLAGPRLDIAERPLKGATLRAASLGGTVDAARLADLSAPTIAAEREFWGDETGPFLIAAGPFRSSVGVTDRTDAVALADFDTADSERVDGVAYGHIRAWIPDRVGRLTAPTPWFSDGFAQFFEDRILLRAGLTTTDRTVTRLRAALRATELPTQEGRDARGAQPQGLLLALKWDEEIRRKSGGKLDLDDVILRMRDHYQRFAPGTGPDVVTGIISAAYVTADLDLRADVDRYAMKGQLVPLPETLFDGCVELRWDRRPVFEAGLDVEGSRAAKALKGVRTRGPAWTSGLRNGMRLEALTLKPGDTSVEVVATVRDARKRVRTVRYWPYGDEMTETRSLVLKPGMNEAETATCGRKIGGL
jgi:predicted metalloprotease with PDZ domain